MIVHGYTANGAIWAVIEGVEVFVPDSVGNRHRQLIAEWEAAGNTIPAYTPPGPTAAEVNAERDRRISAGFTFDGKRFAFDPDSKQRVTGAATLAGFAIAQGAAAGYLLWHGGATPFVWIADDNTLVEMDAPTCFAFGQAAAAHETAHIFAARQLKDISPIPADYADDTHWP